MLYDTLYCIALYYSKEYYIKLNYIILYCNTFLCCIILF